MVERVEKRTALRRGKKQDKLFRAIEYIRKHLAESPSLPETAGHIHVSSSYLSKVFIDCLHTPYSVFVLNEKILYVQKLLVDSKMSMTEIAGAAGFSSNTYFSDCFKRITGISPLQFRKAYTTERHGANLQVERKAWL